MIGVTKTRERTITGSGGSLGGTAGNKATLHPGVKKSIQGSIQKDREELRGEHNRRGERGGTVKNTHKT